MKRRKRRLDQKLVKKICQKIGYSEKYICEQISKRANRIGISSEAWLVIWAKNLGLGTARYQRSLSPTIREEIMSAFPSNENFSSRSAGNTLNEVKIVTKREKYQKKWYEKPVGQILISVVIMIIEILLTNLFGLTKP